MNLFRGRRASLGNSKDEDSSLFSKGGSAAASICRVFMPRSRTSCNLGATNACAVGNNGAAASGGAAAASTDWAYVEPQPRRTASLSRNLTRRSRSVTMPEMPDRQQFSTFKRPPRQQQQKDCYNKPPPAPAPSPAPAAGPPPPPPPRSKSSSYLSQFGSHKLKNGRRDRSVEVAAASVVQTSGLAASSTDGCLSALAEDNDDEDNTPVAGTPDVSHGRRQLSSLDSLLEAEDSCTPGHILNYKAKSNSLPKSAFGSLQLRVAKIRAQLDTLKNDALKTPTAPHPSHESTLHPNTPSCGYEYSLPPNLASSGLNGGAGNGGEDSPLSSSPTRLSPFTTTTTTSSSSSIAAPRVPPFLPLTTTTTTGSSTMSSSPSTLSPASSNSLPSISRPQNLKLPQSHSLNTFPASSNKDSAEAAELNRLIFFFDVMSTQEKIAKV